MSINHYNRFYEMQKPTAEVTEFSATNKSRLVKTFVRKLPSSSDARVFAAMRRLIALPFSNSYQY